MLRYAITDRVRLAARETGGPFMRGREDAHEWESGLLAQAAGLAARGDIDFLQLREKDLAPAALAALAREILEALSAHAQGAPFMHGRKDWHERGSKNPSRPKLLINSRADVALAVRADGVHLTSAPGELTPAQVLSLYSSAGLPVPIVSFSCHTLAEVAAARGSNHPPDPAAAPDLILFGPVFEKRIAGELITEGSGLDFLRQACAAAAPIPVLALGGITAENAPACLAAGAAGIAAIRLFSL